MIRSLTLSAICVFGAAAQFPGANDQTIVRGHVLSDRPILEPYLVELQPLSRSLDRQQTLASTAGDFEFRTVEPGDYRLLITDRQGQPVFEQLTRIDKTGLPLEVRLPSHSDTSPPSGPVTAVTLLHKVPRQALHEYKIAMDARRRADGESALLHLRKVVAIDPEFAEGHNDLATLYIDAANYENALRELDRAAALNPALTIVEMNRALCLSKMGRLADAEISARRAVAMERGSTRSSYLLGIILFAEKQFTSEAVDHLKRSVDQYPLARLAAAQILVRLGRLPEAREQLTTYLDSCKGESCQAVRNSLEKLR